jgi:hypothetical protein
MSSNRSLISPNRFYLYRHIRPDKNEPFYIGVGTYPQKASKSSIDSFKYSRAYSTYKRNKIWKDIFTKNNKDYEVEILLESNDYLFILEKEIEFIKLYGRIDLKTGTLTNLTDGGEGMKNVKTSIFTKEKQSLQKKGKKSSEETKKKQSESHKLRYKTLLVNPTCKTIYQYDSKGNFVKKWKSYMDLQRNTDIKAARISEVIKRDNKFYKGFYWYLEYKGINIDPPSAKKCRRPVVKIDKNTEEELEIFENATAALKTISKNKNGLHYILKAAKENKIYKDFKWRFK